MKYKMELCERYIPCVDCDNTDCIYMGMKEPDCPLYNCDRIGVDCETECELIDKHIEKLRRKVKRNESDHL